VNDARWLAECSYYHNNTAGSTNSTLAQQCIEGITMTDGTSAQLDGDFTYTILSSYLFEGTHEFGFSHWNVLFVKQSPKDADSSENSDKHIVVFEGTEHTLADWLEDGSTLDMESFIDQTLVDNMSAQIENWMVQYSVEKVDSYIGHSAGAEYVKACDRFKCQSDEKSNFTCDKIPVDKKNGNALQDEDYAPFSITFNGYNPTHRAYHGRKQIDLRATGDVVSANLGAFNHMITIYNIKECQSCESSNAPDACSSPNETMGALYSHMLPNFNLVGVNWHYIDQASGYKYNFKVTVSNGVGVQQMSSCNQEILAGPNVQDKFHDQWLHTLLDSF
jgi:hypothetical protein